MSLAESQTRRFKKVYEKLDYECLYRDVTFYADIGSETSKGSENNRNPEQKSAGRAITLKSYFNGADNYPKVGGKFENNDSMFKIGAVRPVANTPFLEIEIATILSK